MSLATGVYDSAVTGVSEASARATCIRMVTSLAYRHRANSAAGWGAGWQTALWAALAAQAGWLLNDHLTARARSQVAAMVTDEAALRLAAAPDYWKNTTGVENYPGDTKAEENSWNSMLLQIACVMYPDHPDHDAWHDRMVELMVAAFSREEDLTSGAVIDGRPIAGYLNGWNINSDGTLVNHDIIHPDYMATVAQNLNADALFRLAGRTPPEATRHNAALVYGALDGVTFTAPPYASPGGTMYVPASADIYYPEGNTWGTMRRMHFAAFDVMVDALGIDTAGAAWAPYHIDYVATMQARSTTGQTYVDAGEDTYAGREQWVALHCGWALLARYAAAT